MQYAHIPHAWRGWPASSCVPTLLLHVESTRWLLRSKASSEGVRYPALVLQSARREWRGCIGPKCSLVGGAPMRGIGSINCCRSEATRDWDWCRTRSSGLDADLIKRCCAKWLNPLAYLSVISQIMVALVGHLATGVHIQHHRTRVRGPALPTCLCFARWNIRILMLQPADLHLLVSPGLVRIRL